MRVTIPAFSMTSRTTTAVPATAPHGTHQSNQGPTVLLRHDSEFSVGSNYHQESPNNLNALQGSALLTAECLGTGLLALPHDIHVLGYAIGLGFLIVNLPINLYAGTVLHCAATAVETRNQAENRLFQECQSNPASFDAEDLTEEICRVINGSTINSLDSEITFPSFSPIALIDRKREMMNPDAKRLSTESESLQSPVASKSRGGVSYEAINQETQQSRQTGIVSIVTSDTAHTQIHHDTATYDFIGMTRSLFRSTRATWCVLVVYYVNIFLVLGNYILVMSHAVSAAFGEILCYPIAGLIASTAMFVVSQSRTLARLGRAATIFSLISILIVVVQCLFAGRVSRSELETPHSVIFKPRDDEDSGILRKLSALGSIGFAVGSQKLFLNIRHELAERSVAPRSLFYSLASFGSFYVAIIVLAGNNPPSFLFDTIPLGISRRIAGLLLWAHVVVSYAINSQAICSSMDRTFFHRFLCGSMSAGQRWILLTAFMAVAAFTVANAIPFFKDLVALIGALTSVPLTLLFPALCWRKHLGVPLWMPTRDSLWSFGLVLFSTSFLVAATAGSLYSIQQDWSSHGAPFACH